MRRRASVFTALAVALAACTPATTASPSASQTIPPTAPPSTLAPSVTPGTSLFVDGALLEVLPADIDGVALLESADGEAELRASVELAKLGEAVASGLAVDSETGDFVLVHVVRLLPGVLDETKFHDWRASFDEGVCRNAGGVVATAEVQIAGRTVFITSCAAAVRSYHVWIADSDLLISASSAGDRRFGELLMKGLTP